MDNLLRAHKQGELLGLSEVAGLKPRLDIDVLLFDKPDAFNLFILALSELQDFKNSADKNGYFMLASIHGLPKNLWDGVANATKSNQSSAYGYCAHGSVRFPTWHRSYLALYEQAIYVKMAEIAERFPEAVRPRYRTALKEFRLPYWDYFRPRDIDNTNQTNTFRKGTDYLFYLPRVFTTENLTVRRTSDDKRESIRNPLYRYINPPKESGGFTDNDWTLAQSQDVKARKCTVRWPASALDTEGRSDAMNKNIGDPRQPNTIIILDRIIDPNMTYESFAQAPQGKGASGNLEALHNQYHGLLGGGTDQDDALGWMSRVPTAAFDPVFWIHHCNIERYASIWQAAHPDSWASTPAGDQLLKTPNAPFRKTRGATPEKDVFWTGTDVRDHTIYGSYYEGAYDPKTQKAPPSADVKKKFRDLYGWSVRQGQSGSGFGEVPESMKPLNLKDAQVYQPPDSVPLNPGPIRTEKSQKLMTFARRAPESVVVAATQSHEEAAVEPDAPTEPSQIPAVKAPSEEALQIDPAPAAAGDSASFAFTNIPEGATDVAPADVDETKYYRDWYVDDIVERLAFNGPFSIFFFIGPFEGDETGHYQGQPTQAGFTYIFTSSRDLCDNCGEQAEEGLLVTDTTPITPILLDYIEANKLDDLSPEKVVPFLIENLKWRIVTGDGQRKDPRQTPGFKVGVSSKLTPRDGDGLDGFLYQEFPQIVDTIIERANRPTSDA